MGPLTSSTRRRSPGTTLFTCGLEGRTSPGAPSKSWWEANGDNISSCSLKENHIEQTLFLRSCNRYGPVFKVQWFVIISSSGLHSFELGGGLPELRCRFFALSRQMITLVSLMFSYLVMLRVRFWFRPETYTYENTCKRF